MTRMHSLAIVCTCAIVLAAIAATAAQESPEMMGQVVSAQEATQNGNPLPAGGTVFESDVISTGGGGQAVVKLSPTSQAELRANTSVLFTRILRRKVVQLHSGNVLVENAGKDFTLVRTVKYNISPQGEAPSKIYVGLMADNTTYIEAADNPLEIEDLKTGQVYVLPAGQNAFVPQNAEGVPGLAPTQPPQTATVKPPATPTNPTATPPAKPKSSSHTGLIVGIAAAAGIGGAVAALAGGHGGGGGSPSQSVP